MVYDSSVGEKIVVPKYYTNKMLFPTTDPNNGWADITNARL